MHQITAEASQLPAEAAQGTSGGRAAPAKTWATLNQD